MTTKLTVWLAVAWCLLLASQKSLRFRMFIIENSVGDISVEWYWSLQRSMLSNQQLYCISFANVFVAFYLVTDYGHVRCWLLLLWMTLFFGWVCFCDAIPSHAMMDGNANSLLGLILLTMWYNNNILKPAHDRALSFFRKSIWLRRLGTEWNGKHRWWITSDWHTKIITHIFFSASYPFIRWFSCRFRVSPNNILFTLSSSPFNVLYMKITLFLSFLCVRWVLGVCRLMLNTFHVVEIGSDGHTACFPESHRFAPIIVRRLHAQWLTPLNKYRHPCLVTPN